MRSLISEQLGWIPVKFDLFLILALCIFVGNIVFIRIQPLPLIHVDLCRSQLTMEIVGRKTAKEWLSLKIRGHTGWRQHLVWGGVEGFQQKLLYFHVKCDRQVKSSSSYSLKSLAGFNQLPSVQLSWVCFTLQRAPIQKTPLLSLLKQISLINRFIFSVFVLHTNQFNNNLSIAVNSVNFLLPTSIIGAVLFWTRLRAQKLKVVVLCGSSAIRIQWRNLRSIYQTWESQRRGYGSQWTQYLCQIWSQFFS